MHSTTVRRASATLAPFAFLLATAAHAASGIVPKEPLPFETVNLRLEADSCAFAPESVRVETAGAAIRVSTRDNQCLLAGEPRVVDIRLGAYPVGRYRVELVRPAGGGVVPVEVFDFEVREPPRIAVFPPPPRPLADYSGMWWNPLESGWGLSLHQGAGHALFGAIFVYGADTQPRWYTIQPGGWTGYASWSGVIYRTTGPFFAGPDFDPRLVLVQPAGTASLDFEQSPGTVGRARLRYTVDGVSVTKTIERLRL